MHQQDECKRCGKAKDTRSTFCKKCFTTAPDLSGKKFGRLVVESRADKPVTVKRGCTDAFWRCRCDCGEIVTVRASNMILGISKSCGCWNADKQRLEDGLAMKNSCFGVLRRNANKRNLLVEITFEDFVQLSEQDCSYCGMEPSSPGPRDFNTKWQHNGIDRVNNKIGYTKENSVPCCALCNYFKNKLSLSDFIGHVNRIAEHQSRNELLVVHPDVPPETFNRLKLL